MCSFMFHVCLENMPADHHTTIGEEDGAIDTIAIVLTSARNYSS